MTSPASSKRPLWTVVAVLLLGAAALWGASRFVWFAELTDGGVRGMILQTQTGAQRSAALLPLAVLAVAGVAGMVATGGWARRVLGIVMSVAGLAACWVAIDGVRFSGFPAGAPVWQIFTGRGLALLGGILVVLGGLIAIKHASAMPRLGARYAAPSVKKTARDPDTELWEALSEGEDPTRDS
ncbi:Trp biosynthesis-associated membrane protein [Amycolatopsis sp. K13G38]|uniref:Trp biosynthesis-associated membrane protein n=1 Tax=Amycolatopsis acididurans TaxID=2724524 RepID=A0ABX1JDP7_9PSEU|nr:Trp biosynthesis-associated membrane protein [Amycolatopsis acididurans]NKQ56581.1 Trp biosynthesis-associated membrane protein [Amycolatopsis acididurans]